MKCKLFRMAKKTLAGVLAMATIAVGVLVLPTYVEAAPTKESIDYKVEFQSVDYSTFNECISAKKAPEYKPGQDEDCDYGYLFAGWYKEANEDKEITTASDVTTGTTVYAKFVPSYVLSIKSQNAVGSSSEDAAMKLRVVSSTDSLRYSEVGFKVARMTENENGCYTIANEKAYPVKQLYKGGLDVYDAALGKDVDHTTDKVFGSKASYVSALILNIKSAKFSTVYRVQPYWKTFDGTTVEGLGRFVSANDGWDGYLNFPINLKDSDAVAAGVLSVDYSDLTADGFVLQEVKGGIVFQEMAYAEKENSVIKCVGNVENIEANAESNDIYMNLKFEVPDKPREYNGKFYHISIDDVDFSNKDEKQPSGYNVWDIQY